MKLPEPRRLKSGMWNVQVQIEGKRISVTEPTAELCRNKAMLLKAQGKNGLLQLHKPTSITLRQAMDNYIAVRSNILSPSTIAGYRDIQRLRFQEVMDSPISSVKNWQAVVNNESAKKNKKGKKISSENYTLSYSSGRKNVGTYTVTVKFKGNYSGTKKLSFKVNPKGTSVSKATSPKRKQIKVTWKKQSTQTTGYQIQYSTDKSYKKGVKTVTVKGTANTQRTIGSLTSKKTYYVRIRTYKKVSGTNYYSAWSSAKYTKVK